MVKNKEERRALFPVFVYLKLVFSEETTEPSPAEKGDHLWWMRRAPFGLY